MKEESVKITTRLVRTACAILYYGLARHLPGSLAPSGFITRRVRSFLCRRMFRNFGHNVNIEHGVSFIFARDSSIGSNSGIGANSLIGLVTIGNDVMMGPNVTIISQNHEFHDTDRPMREQGAGEHKRIIIEDDVWIGANVIILPEKKICRGSILGAGAVITKDVEPYSIVAGNPARRIGWRGTSVS